MRTVLPARLLCRFISVRESRSNSRASMNLRAYRIPKSTSAEQPPHFQGSSGVPPPVGVALCRTSQPHVEMLPRAQAAVTAYAAPALAIA